MKKPKQGVSPQQLQELRALLTSVHGLRVLLERFARGLPAGPAGAGPSILRSRVACVLHDRIALAIQDLEAAIAEVERGT
jgi:hypothetical protein